MATITVQSSLDGTTTKSILTITEKSRTSEKTTFSLTFKTNFVYSAGYIGTGESLSGKVQISGTGITTQTKTTTLKSTSDNWSGTTTHTKTATFEVEIPASVTNISVKYTLSHSPSSDSVSSNTTMSLTKMASVLGTIASFDVESEISIPITKNVSNYYDVLRIYDENKNQLYYYGDVFNGATLSLTAYGLNRLYEVMAQNTHNFTFELTTYSDDTMETTIGTNSKVVQGYITNANPVFSDFDYEDVDEKVLTLTGGNYFVKGYSDIKISNLVATGTKGATIKYWNINNSLIENTGSNEIVLENHNSNSMTIYAVDSRGNSIPLTKLIDNFIEYTKLTKGNQDHGRINNVTEQVNIAFEGDIYECDFGLIENSLEVSYKYKKTTDNEYITSDRTIEPTIANNKYSYDGLVLGDTTDGFNSGFSYNLEVTIKDVLSEVTFSYVIQAGIPAFAIYGNKIALGDMFDENKSDYSVQLWNKTLCNGVDFDDFVNKIGSIWITSSNKNPSSMFGGTWELIDKEFISWGGQNNNILSANSSNVSSHSAFFTRSGHSITINIVITVSNDVDDNTFDLGNIDFDIIGISGITANMRTYAWADGGEGIAMMGLSSAGELNSFDVVSHTNANVIPSGSTLYYTTSFNVRSGHMLDSACGKFYWKRTA